jgi:hypothetical protein
MDGFSIQIGTRAGICPVVERSLKIETNIEN